MTSRQAIYTLSSHKRTGTSGSFRTVRLALIASCVLSLSLAFITAVTAAHAEQTDYDELKRLVRQADDLIAQGDPNGAALAIGKAALMAQWLARQQTDDHGIYNGIESFFRAQEAAYRAIALFEQAGGQLPAPAGTCRLLNTGTQRHQQASDILDQHPPDSPAIPHDDLLDIQERAREWDAILEDLPVDYGCADANTVDAADMPR